MAKSVLYHLADGTFRVTYTDPATGQQVSATLVTRDEDQAKKILYSVDQLLAIYERARALEKEPDPDSYSDLLDSLNRLRSML